jgi:hypothetical protein
MQKAFGIGFGVQCSKFLAVCFVCSHERISFCQLVQVTCAIIGNFNDFVIFVFGVINCVDLGLLE